MKLSSEQMQELVDYLQGTCMSLEQGVEDCFETDLNGIENEMEMCDYLDNRLFLCGQCGWWCESGDWISEENPNYDPCNGDICTSCGDY